MIIKFIQHKKLPKTKRVGQVIEGDFKDLHRHVKGGWAEKATQADLDKWVEKLKSAHKPVKPQPQPKAKEPCEECKKKNTKRKCKGCQDK